MPQIQLSGISKRFTVYERPEGKFGIFKGAFARKARTVRALDDIGFSIQEGELVGYIGPNGAGKSTTVKVMSGILTPDAGACTILGRTPWKERVAHVSRIGVVFGQRSQLWWDVPVSDSFNLIRDIYALPESAFRTRLGELVEVLDLSPLLKTPVRQLSLGQRIRCEVAASLLHSPAILFLDEPTIGLDAVSKLSLRAFLKEENRRHGVTMVLTTHDMDDIEALCDRVMVIGHGKLLYNGGLPALKERYAPTRTLELTLTSHHMDPASLLALPGVVGASREKNTARVEFDPAHTPAHKLIAQLAERLPVADVSVEERDIDEIIAAMYRELDL